MNCESIRDQLTAYLLGDLDPKTLAEIREHLEECDGCRALARDIEPTLDLLRNALAATSSKAPARLSPDRRGRIRAESGIRHAKRGSVIQWFTTRHPSFTRAAAIVVIGLVIVALVSPMFLVSFQGKARLDDVTRNRLVALSARAEKPVALGRQSRSHGEEATAGGESSSDHAYKSQLRGFNCPRPKGFFSRLKKEAPAPAETTAAEVPTTGSPVPAEAVREPSQGMRISDEAGQELREKIKQEAEKLPSPTVEAPMEGVSNIPNQGAGRGRGKGTGADVGEGDKAGFMVSGKTPLVMKGLYGSRSPGGRGRALSKYGLGAVDSETGATGGGRLGLENKEGAAGTGGAPVDDFSIEVRESPRELSLAEGLSSPAAASTPQSTALATARSDRDEEARVTAPRTISMSVDGKLATKDFNGKPTREEQVEGKRKMPRLPLSRSSSSKEDVVARPMAVTPGDTVVSIDKLAEEGEGCKNELRQDSGAPREEAKKMASARQEKPAGQQVQQQLQAGEDKKVIILGDIPLAERLIGSAGGTVPAEELDSPRFKATGVNPFVKAVEQPFSTFSIGVDTASYTLMRNYMLKGSLPPAESVRTEEFVNFFDYAYTAPTRETFRVYVDAAPSKFGHGLQLMKIGVKGRRLGREEQRRAMLTFLVDTSGSMDKPDRIGLVKTSLKMLIEKMAPQDMVAIVQFDSHARLVLEATPVSDKKKILAAIDALQCGGSTNLEEGMLKAYELAARNFVPGGESRVLLLSDGVANLGNMAAEDILGQVAKYRKQGIFCSVFGVGMGTYDDTMLQTLAAKGDGAYAFLDSEDEAKRLFVDDLSATLNTIAKDVKIQVEFNPKAVATYRQLGYESRQLKKEDFRNDAVQAGEVGSGQSVTALYEMQLRGQKSEANGQWSAGSGDDRIATVRIRYRRTDNGKVEEIEQPVKLADAAKSFDEADVRFRLAACVAEFSEILRGSPFVQGREFKDVAETLRPVALDLNLDSQVQELLRLISAASGMPRSAVRE